MKAGRRAPRRSGSLADPAASAEEASLRYVTDTLPGIARRRSGKGFRYVDAAGESVSDPETLARIRSLAIPPAWSQVWICPRPDGHLQATGRDARVRKQYRYHRRFRALREENKYHRLIVFGELCRRYASAFERTSSSRGSLARRFLRSSFDCSRRR